MNLRRILSQVALVAVALVVSVGVQQVFAAGGWGPSSAPPLNGKYAPLNTSAAPQVAAGLVNVGTSSPQTGLIVAAGTVGIGVQFPVQKLEVEGIIKTSTGGIMFPDNTIQTTAAVGGVSSSGLSCITRKGGTSAYCSSGEIMIGGTCRGTDFCDGGDSSSYGGLYDGNGVKCNQVGCSNISANVRCCRDASTVSELLYNWNHTVSACTSIGGTVVTAGTNRFCKITASGCPSGWNKYYNYSTTVAKTCAGTDAYASCGRATTCTTPHHSWSNVSTETCEYISSSTGFCIRSYLTCTATVSEIGCY